MFGKKNDGFVGDENTSTHGHYKNSHAAEKIDLYTLQLQEKRKHPITLALPPDDDITSIESGKDIPTRATWGSGMEFLMSCIAMSVGLGNIWRFPFVAYENGGGAFLIPYIIVLFLIGKPYYYLEMILGQFFSKSCVKVWSIVPGFRGVGWAQMYSMAAVSTYYCSVMALTLHYLVYSFSSVLPWAKCAPEWGENCIDSDTSLKGGNDSINGTVMKSSAELYFLKSVLYEKNDINDGIGMPDWKLTLFLFISWVCVAAILARGVKSSGKAAYFLALFPYVIIVALLIKALTLEGAINGIYFFIKPDWAKLLEAKVWYNAVVQCFFSLAICFGDVVMYASYNTFRHNIHRDVLVVTMLDTFTSLLAGFTIFGILGNLAYELNIDDISKVTMNGPGLAFISYPDAISKFAVMPQLFSALFFLMLFILGIGSGIGIAGAVIAIIHDQYPHWKRWHIVVAFSAIGFCIGTIYCTPGGQFMFELVDFYAASFIAFFLAVLEIIGAIWIYGLENLLDDVEFMLNKRPSVYWRLCWAVLTPLTIITILVYSLISMTVLTHNKVDYPAIAHVIGWILFTIGIGQIPIWFGYSVYRNRHHGFPRMIIAPFKPSKSCSPLYNADSEEWKQFKEIKISQRRKRECSSFKVYICLIFGLEDKLL